MLCADIEGWDERIRWEGRDVQERGDICIHTANSICSTTENNATLQSNYIPIFVFPSKKKKFWWQTLTWALGCSNGRLAGGPLLVHRQ